MKRIIAALGLVLCGCSEAPRPAEQKEDAAKTAGDEASTELKAEKKSIEQAADAAAKLVEDEANAEIAEIKGGQ